MSLYRNLIPVERLNTDWARGKEDKTIEGWLCKTAPRLVKDQVPFQKAYCVLDLQGMYLLLCGKDDGKVIEKVELADRLCHVETSLTNKVDLNRFHPMGDRSLLEGL